MSKGGPRFFDVAKKLPYETGTYCEGPTLQRVVASAGNSACGMRSSTPRSFQRATRCEHDAAPPIKTIGMAKEQLQKPNSGVGLAMSSPRVGVPLPASVREATKPRTVTRSLKLTHVTRPAVWGS